MITLAIIGSKGRMGQMLLACAARQPDLKVVGQVDQGDDLESAVAAAQVVVDFSLPEATRPVAVCCAAHRKPLVIGTTGHAAGEKAEIARFQAQIPMVWSANYATGVNALFWLTRKAAEILGPGFDLEIVEMHHRHKKDAPSGTATTLAEILAAVRHQQLVEVVRHGRVGLVGERTATEIGLHALRGGDVVGDHTVVFATAGERVELTHRATSRETLANGALRAARWVFGQPPGLYSMQDVLGLK
ncbi:MAG: 4-hydroxy-tetrahydrodipicolinate reductase [Verrucomicrobia bacterium]|nr:4-hydroxy-tetrahydrodipicolinate reductase [Verrucomicrobiota bacterium]